MKTNSCRMRITTSHGKSRFRPSEEVVEDHYFCWFLLIEGTLVNICCKKTWLSHCWTWWNVLQPGFLRGSTCFFFQKRNIRNHTGTFWAMRSRSTMSRPDWWHQPAATWSSTRPLKNYRRCVLPGRFNAWLCHVLVIVGISTTLLKKHIFSVIVHMMTMSYSGD